MLISGIRGQEATLYTALGLNSPTGSYNADVRPRIDHNEIIHVTVDLELHTIVDMVNYSFFILFETDKFSHTYKFSHTCRRTIIF